MIATLSGEAWTAIGIVGAAGVAAWSAVTIAWINRSAERRSRPVVAVAEQLSTSIGVANGQGNVVQMLERIDKRCARLEAAFYHHSNQNAADHAAMRDRDETISNHLDKHTH